MKKLLTERFEEKYIPIPESGCWIWTAKTNLDGYGGFKWCGKMELAHRISWRLYNGSIPDDMCVLHECDTPACVNPYHLFLGTKKDNTRDSMKKGRFPNNFFKNGIHWSHRRQC